MAASRKIAYKTNGVVTVPSGQTFDTTIETKTYGKIAWQTTLLHTTVGYTVTIYDMDRNELGTSDSKELQREVIGFGTGRSIFC